MEMLTSQLTWIHGMETKGVELYLHVVVVFIHQQQKQQQSWRKVIGVDTDQAPIIDKAGEGLTITSAMKGLGTTVTTVLTDIKADKWSNYGGKIDKLGLVSENADENFVQLPVESTQWNDGFTEDDYHALVKSMYDGDIKVSNDITAMPKTEITVNDYGSIK